MKHNDQSVRNYNSEDISASIGAYSFKRKTSFLNFLYCLKKLGSVFSKESGIVKKCAVEKSPK